jgi:predicted O-linked N-acetylglucosamine transferase (SPINDLY family)
MHGLARPKRASSPTPPRHDRRAQADPARAEYERGLALAAQSRWPLAAGAFERAVTLNARDAVYWLNLAHARIQGGDVERGAEAALHAAGLAPDSETCLAVVFECLNAANRHAQTVQLIAGRPDRDFKDPRIHFLYGEALRNLYRFGDASRAYLAALSRRPDFMQAHVQLGNCFERLLLPEEARECFRTGVLLGGNAVELTSAMCHQDLQACRWDLWQEDLAQLLDLIRQGRGQPAPFHMLAQPSTRHQQLDAARAHAAQLFTGVPPLPAPAPAPENASPRIRLGYLSSDFFEHATAYLLSEVLEHHDRSRFEVFAYSYGLDDGSQARRRIERAVDHFIDAQHLSERALADRVRADGIDILFDLKGYTLGARNRVLACRPAPIQVNYLGYPGTLGSSAYDYVIGDPTVTPLAHADGYDEAIAQMPRCYQPNDRRRPIGVRPARADCALPERGFVFCSFNNPYKFMPDVFEVWCRLLAAVEGSVLWLYESNDQARRNLARALTRRGLDPQRLVWASHAPLAAHLGRLQLADLVLDTRPVCGHTTASDALWAGVPVVACPGDTFISRVAASLLRAVDLPELIAADLPEYESIALRLAREPQRLAALRDRLAAQRDRCALFDSAGYTRDFEALLLRMMDRHERGLPPAALAAAAGP